MQFLKSYTYIGKIRPGEAAIKMKQMKKGLQITIPEISDLLLTMSNRKKAADTNFMIEVKIIIIHIVI